MAAEGEKKGAMEAEKGAADAREIITLKSSDGVVRRVKKAVASLSGLISRSIEDGCADGDVPLPNVEASTLDTVLEYCNKHADPGAAAAATNSDSDPTAAAAGGSSSSSSVDTAASDDMKAWDREFLDLLSLDALYDLLLAADYLQIEGLQAVICQRAADMIKGKTTQQIRDTFNIVNDLTPEDEEELRQQYAWAFDE
ncbi:hypothetical protein SEVIR_2G408000v4 [Setaria viridis]|uniref:SKP1-like protein n=3 Tax=Setaria TaxID=4554 RepID=A0A368Q7Q7_SETIT|nr:SKP1-like protein 1B [Setaria italica]XP_034578155.1 SKP1-like protein 1 [Setaria viridis]RCV14057.1 hypothetical protein SETIT_2G396600v2 [Setaria italica]TKW35936.1 hypothetical protein SEVIR_2G408000v2 [Setaria viridis]